MSTNLHTYIRMRGDLSFKQSPFNELDAAVLSAVVGIDLSDAFDQTTPLSKVFESYNENKVVQDKDDYYGDKLVLFEEAAGSNRFKDILMENFVKDINLEQEKTFYGVTFRITKRLLYIAFRGTDGTLISWRENFNTLYQLPTMGQVQAKEYIASTLKKYPFSKCMIGGHSKGANLACYAAIFAEKKYQRRIEKVYSLDGPGFTEDVTKTPGFEQIKAKIVAIIPEESVVGRLMNPPYDNAVVKSTSKGVFQHDVFSWEVDATCFTRVPDTNEASDVLSNRINEWIEAVPVEERPKVVEELFDIFEKNNIDHVNKLIHVNFRTMASAIKSLASLSHDNRKLLVIIAKELFDSK